MAGHVFCNNLAHNPWTLNPAPPVPSCEICGLPTGHVGRVRCSTHENWDQPAAASAEAAGDVVRVDHGDGTFHMERRR
jgi:hypothetical protein